MIIPTTQSVINGVQCYFSKKHIDSFHLVYDSHGFIVSFTKGKMEVGTTLNLYVSTEPHEIILEVHKQGCYLNGNTQIVEELKYVFGL